MAVCRLGQCTSDAYRVIIRDRGTPGSGKQGPEIAELDFKELNWDRRLDEVSEATVELPPECCGKLADIWPWRHELSISRDGEEQWCGPVRVQPSCTNGLFLKATDMSGWLQRRAIHNNHDSTVVDTSSVQLAIDLIKDGFAPDDPHVLKYLTQYGTGVTGGWNYPANSKYVMDALLELAKGAIDFTTIGRRIIVMPSGYTLGKLPLLTCDHFKQDLCTTTDGDAYASRAIVTGLAVTGTAGGIDQYAGLVEILEDNQAIGKQTTADTVAAGLLNGKDRVPVLIQPPQGDNGLAPDAPVCLSQLVPGVTVPVSINCTCKTAVQDMRLTRLNVTVNADGENVQPLLAPLGFDTAA